MPCEEFCHWIAKVTVLLGHQPEPNGVEEAWLKNEYYCLGMSPERAVFLFRQALAGPPQKDRRLHF